MEVYHIAILPGEGVGPEVVRESLKVLDTITQIYGHEFRIYEGGLIGKAAFDKTGSSFPQESKIVCDKVLKEGGAVLSGPGSGDYVYRIRECYELHCKLVVLQPIAVLKGLSSLKEKVLEGINILIVRENTGGIYFGERGHYEDKRGIMHAFQTMAYSKPEVEAIARIAFREARKRKKEVTSVDKIDAITEVGHLWRGVMEEVSKDYPEVKLEHMLIDHAAFQMLNHPRSFDVIVAPNLFGDILADLGAVFYGSRGMLCSGNFSPHGFGVYQAGHGCAFDIAGKGVANPIGQILAGGMMLRHSFNLQEEAEAVERAVETVLGRGYRTADIMEEGKMLVNTKETGRLIAEEIKR